MKKINTDINPFSVSSVDLIKDSKLSWLIAKPNFKNISLALIISLSIYFAGVYNINYSIIGCFSIIITEYIFLRKSKFCRSIILGNLFGVFFVFLIDILLCYVYIPFIARDKHVIVFMTTCNIAGSFGVTFGGFIGLWAFLARKSKSLHETKDL